MPDSNVLTMVDGGCVQLLHGYTVKEHSMYCSRILVPIDGLLEISTSRNGLRSRRPVVVGSDTSVYIHSPGSVVSIHLAPDAQPGASVYGFAGQRAVEASGRLYERLCSIVREGGLLLDDSAAAAGVLSESAACFDAVKPDFTEPVRKVLDLVTTCEGGELTVDFMASRIGVKKDSLSSLFKQQLGTTLSRYLLNQRTRRAFSQIATGRDLLSSSTDAGFSDQSHLTRTTRLLSGRTPGQVRENCRMSFVD